MKFWRAKETRPKRNDVGVMSDVMPITKPARAKINLYLHVLARRPDGYHELDTLVVFADIADELHIAPAPQISLTIDGPFAKGLEAGPDNLIWRAAEVMCQGTQGAAIHLTKNLPIAAGIGGGSADAAAVLHGLREIYGRTPDPAAMQALGADVPMCYAGAPARATGVGEVLNDVPPLPPFWVVLANRLAPVSTASVFRALKIPPKGRTDFPTAFENVDALVAFLGRCKNDLVEAALAVEPGITEVRDGLLDTPGCRFAQMSGSGGTCFGIYADDAAAQRAARALKAANPSWWVAAAAASHNAGNNEI